MLSSDVLLRKGPTEYGQEQLVALIQESLWVAHKTGAIGAKDLERVVFDTTVQPRPLPIRPTRC
ncbi:hypothetical protein ACVWXO_000982 [Bradyrhizobium sp. LM2.7]